MNRRQFLGRSVGILAGAAGLPALSACGSDRSGDSDTITALLITGGDKYPQYWEKVTTAFRKQTGITVEYDLLQFTPLTSKEITLAAARSDQYDVYSTHTAQIGVFFPHFEPLNDLFSRSELDDFFPVATKYLTNPTTGELAAIPRNMDSRTQYYRADLYEEASVGPARTWDELVDVGRRFTKGLQHGLVLPGQGDPAQRQFADFLWQAGGDWLDDDDNVAFNSPEGVEALSFYRDLVQRYRVSPSDTVTYQWNENSAGFSNGSCASVFDWPGAYATFSDPAASTVSDAFATAPLPAHKTSVSNAISHAMAINRYSRKKEAAGEFVKFTVTGPALLDQFREFTNYPSRRSIADQVGDEAKGAQKRWLDDLRSTVEHGREWPKVPGFNKVSTVVQTAVQAALSDQRTPKQALDEAARESTRILRQARELV